MKTVVAFTNNKVQVICGEGTASSIQVSKIIDVQFDVNCVLGGVITDQDVFAAGIKKTWADNDLPKKGVTLCVEGNSVKSKRVKIPKVDGRKTLEIISREFKEMEQLNDPVFSFVTLGEEGTEREIMAFEAETDFVKALITAFSSVGIKVEAITSARCAMLKLLTYIDTVTGRSCIVQVMDEDVLTTVLVESGQLTNISSGRLFSEHNTTAFGAEVARNVSQLIQFQSSERSQSVVNQVYMAGFEPEDYQVAKEQIEGLSLSVQPFSEGGRLKLNKPMNGSVFLHAGALVLGKLEGNLFTAYKDRLKNTQKTDKVLLKFLPILIIAAILMGITSFQVVENMKRQEKANQLTAYVESEENLNAQLEYAFAMELAALLNSRVANTQEIKNAIESFPRATSALNKIIASSGTGIVEVNITSYVAESGVLNFTAVGKDAKKINEFIKALTDTEVFYNVGYSGYTLAQDKVGYSVNVSCVLSAKAGR